MRRKDINRTEYAYIAAELIDSETLPGAENVLIVSGMHEQHGRVILITAGETRIAICDDASFVTGIDEQPDF